MGSSSKNRAGRQRYGNIIVGRFPCTMRCGMCGLPRRRFVKMGLKLRGQDFAVAICVNCARKVKK